MRFVYNLLIHLAAVPGLALQFWRGRHAPGHRARLGERLGFGEFLPAPAIWIHAVSVGEMQAAAPLVRTLLGRYPQYPLLITTVTPTGADRARQLFGDAVQLRYVPVDLPGSVRRFFDRVRPRLALILETELWPNLYAECGHRGVPLVLASARISPRSVGRYRRLVPLFRQTLSHGIVIAAQSARDAERFLSIGAAPERTHVTGNIKFDFEPSPETAEQGACWRRDHANQRPVWVAGSTHEGEESMVLDAHRRVREQFPDALLLLVPRHPPRFGAVRELLLRRGEAFVTRSSEDTIGPEVAVMLGDSMGELTGFYAAADVAFVGGSLVPIGGHNLLEPAAVGKPVLTGPHCFNDEAAMRLLVEADAASIVTDSGQLARRVIELFSQPQQRAAMGDAGRRVVDENRGALDRLLRLVEPLLDEAAGVAAALPRAARIAWNRSMSRPAMLRAAVNGDAGIRLRHPYSPGELAALVARFGSPLLVIDCAIVRRQYRALAAALPGVDLHYALKPLPEADVVRVLAEEGSWFDLATSGEVELVRGAGIPARRCIHTHPIKRDADIRAALDFGVTTFVADNPDELAKLHPYRDRVRLLLRLAFRSPQAIVDLSRKFGCDPDDTLALAQQAAGLGLCVAGLSFHVGSQVASPEMYLRAIETCAALIRQGRERSLGPFEVLDIGGGFPIDYLRAAPEIGAFCGPIRAALATLPPGLRVIAEPGRFLCGPAGLGLATVIGRARRGGRWWYYLDDGLYGSFSGQLYDGSRYPVEPVLPHAGPPEPCVIAGPTCDSIDVVAEDIPLPELQIGDLLLGRQMGAYTSATATDFNFFPRARVLTVNVTPLDD